MKYLSVAVALFFLASSSIASASEYWETCDGCSLSKMEWRAKQAVPPNTQGAYSVYIMDVSQERIEKFSVFVFYDYGTNLYFAAASVVEIEADIANAYTNFVTDLKSVVAVLQAGTTIPIEVGGSAFDLIHASSQQLAVADYIAGNLDFWQVLGGYGALPLLVMGKIASVNIVILATFADGSTVTYELTGITETAEGTVVLTFKYRTGSAVDADGNSIPESSADAAPYAGTYSSSDLAATMQTYIINSYGYSGISCTVSETEDHITLTCKKS